MALWPYCLITRTDGDRSACSAFRRSAAPAPSPPPPPCRPRRGRTPCRRRRAPAPGGADEERRRGAVRSLAARHRDDPFDVLRVVELRRQVVHELLLLLGQRRWRARSAPVWIDEARRDAMERHAVVDARRRRAAGTGAPCPGALSGKNSIVIGPSAGVEHRAVAARAAAAIRRRTAPPRRVADRDAADLDPLGGEPLASTGVFGNLLQHLHAVGDPAEHACTGCRAPAGRQGR